MLHRGTGATVKETTDVSLEGDLVMRSHEGMWCAMWRIAARHLPLVLMALAVATTGWASDTDGLRTPTPPTGTGHRGIPSPNPSSLESTPMSAPSLGFVWDVTSHSLRRVDGIAGAALVGTSFFGRNGFTNAAIAPNQAMALLTNGAGAVYAVALPPAGQPVLLANDVPSGVQIAFSPSGNTALLYSANGGSALLVTGLPTAPKVNEIASLTGISGITSAIVSDTGTVLIARANASNVSISSAGVTASLMPVAAVGQWGGMAFLSGAETAVVADGANNILWKVTGIGGAVSMSVVANAADGVSQPALVALSEDNKTVWTMSAGGTTIAAFSLTGSMRETSLLATPFTVTGLARLNGRSVFALLGSAAGSFFVLDGDWPAGRIVQVPITPLRPLPGGVE